MRIKAHKSQITGHLAIADKPPFRSRQLRKQQVHAAYLMLVGVEFGDEQPCSSSWHPAPG